MLDIDGVQPYPKTMGVLGRAVVRITVGAALVLSSALAAADTCSDGYWNYICTETSRGYAAVSSPAVALDPVSQTLVESSADPVPFTRFGFSGGQAQGAATSPQVDPVSLITPLVPADRWHTPAGPADGWTDGGNALNLRATSSANDQQSLVGVAGGQAANLATFTSNTAEQGRPPPLPRDVRLAKVEEAKDGDPVRISNGEFLHERADLEIASGAGIPAFRLIRTYRSRSNHHGPLGHGWELNVEESISEGAAFCSLQGPTAGTYSPQIEWKRGSSIVRFRQTASGSWQPAEATNLRLRRSVSGGVTRTIITDAQGTEHEFGAVGPIRKLRDRSGREVSFVWSPCASSSSTLDSQLSQILLGGARDILFTYVGTCNSTQPRYLQRAEFRVSNVPQGSVTYTANASKGELEAVVVRGLTGAIEFSESYEYEPYDASRLSSGPTLPQPAVRDACRRACGVAAGSCGTCSGSQENGERSCQRLCATEQSACVNGAGSWPGCVSFCKSTAACRATDWARRDCEGLCRDGTSASFTPEQCAFFEPIQAPYNATIAQREQLCISRGFSQPPNSTTGQILALPTCGESISEWDGRDFYEPNCCPLDNGRTRSVHASCLAGELRAYNGAQACAFQAANWCAQQPSTSICAPGGATDICPALGTCETRCAGETVCHHYTTDLGQAGFSWDVVIGPGSGSAGWVLEVTANIVRHLVRLFSTPSVYSGQSCGPGICANNNQSCPGTGGRGGCEWDIADSAEYSFAQLYTPFTGAVFRESPGWQCNLHNCRSACTNCSLTCVRAFETSCEANFTSQCRNGCPAACTEHLETPCRDECTSECISDCNDVAACADRCAHTDFSGACATSCVDACVTESESIDRVYGYEANLNHNIVRVRDGDGRVFVLNRYGRDPAKPDFDRVVAQTFGDEIFKFTTFDLKARDVDLGEYASVVDLNPAAEELCPSECSGQIGSLTGRERWVSVREGEYLVFPEITIEASAYAVETAQGLGAVSAFAWYELERLSETEATIRPAVPLPPGGLNIRLSDVDRLVLTGGSQGRVVMSISSGTPSRAFSSTGRATILVTPRGALWVRQSASLGATISPAHGCSPTFTVTRAGSTATLSEGHCDGSMVIRELGRATRLPYRPVLSSIRGRASWTFNGESGTRTAQDFAQEPWLNGLAGCERPAPSGPPDPICESMGLAPGLTPRPSCIDPWTVRSGSGGMLPLLGGPTLDCGPDLDPVLVEGPLPPACYGEQTAILPARPAGAHIQPITQAVLVEQGQRSTTYYFGDDGLTLRSRDNVRATVTDYNFDARGRLLGQRDAAGIRTCFAYTEADDAYRITVLPATTDKVGSSPIELRTRFGSFGQPITSYDPSNIALREVWRAEQNPDGSYSAVERPDGDGTWFRTAFSYVGGELATATEPRVQFVARYPTGAYWPDRMTAVRRSDNALLSDVGLQRDVMGRVTQQTDARGTTERLTLRFDGNIETRSVQLEPGWPFSVESFAYTTDGLLWSVAKNALRGPTGAPAAVGTGQSEVRVEYDLQGRVVSSTDWAGAATGSTQVAASRSTCYAFVDGEPVLSRGPDGIMTEIRYVDAARRVYDVYRGSMSRTLPTACSGSSLGSSTAREERVARVWLDEAGRMERVELGDGTASLPTVTSVTYDGLGRRITSTDAAGTCTRTSYDRGGRVAWEATYRGTNAVASPDCLDRAPSTQLSSLHPALESFVRYNWDTDGRLLSIDELWFVRDGQTARAAGPNGQTWRTTRFEYKDSQGLTRTIGADGRVESIIVDPLGRPQRRELGPALETWTYSALGRTIDHVRSDGARPSGTAVTAIRTTSWGAPETITVGAAGQASGTLQSLRVSYTFDGRAYQIQTPEATTQLTFDSLKNVTERSRLVGSTYESTERSEYSPGGRILNVFDGRGNKTSYLYDSLGRHTTTQLPTGLVETVTYLGGSSLVQSARTASGEDITYRYDGLGRPTQVEGRRGTLTTRLTWTHGVFGPTEAASETLGIHARVLESFSYDSLGFLSKSSSDQLGDVTYGRDSNGRAATISSATVEVARTWDPVGRLDTVRWGGTAGTVIADIAYPTAGDGPATSVVRPGHVLETRRYDDLGRMTRREVSRASAAPSLVQNFVWNQQRGSLSAWERRVSPTTTFDVSHFTNDSIGRLAQTGVRSGQSTTSGNFRSLASEQSLVAGLQAREAFEYDAADTLTTRTTVRSGATAQTLRPKYNTDLSLSQWQNPELTDAAGRALSVGGSQLEYDALGRLLRSTTAGQVTTYLHDASGLLVGWDAPGASVRLLRAEGKILREKAGTIETVYVPGEGAVPLSVVRNGVFGHNIEAFGTRLHAALDNTGVPVERYEYTAQGQPSIFPVAAGSAARPTSSYGNRLLLAGQPWLSNIESYSMGFRLYRPEWSRFLTADPLGMIDGPNRFAYAGMSPIEYIDPWGLDKRKQVFGCVTRGVLGFHRTYCGTMSQPDWDRDSANTRTIVSQQTIENSRTSLGGAIGAGVWMAVSDDPNEILAASEVGAVLSNAGGAGLAIHATRTENMRIQAIRPAKAPTAEYTVYEELPRPVPVLLPPGSGSAKGAEGLKLSDQARSLFRQGKTREALDVHYEDLVRRHTGGASGYVGPPGAQFEVDSITPDALIQAKRVWTAIDKPKNFLNKATRTQIKSTIREATNSGRRAEFWFKYGLDRDVRSYIESHGGLVRTGMGD